MKEETKKYEFVRFVYKGHPDNGQKNWWFVAKTTDDACGNQKWNTRMEAMQAAKWYLETYYDYYEN